MDIVISIIIAILVVWFIVVSIRDYMDIKNNPEREQLIKLLKKHQFYFDTYGLQENTGIELACGRYYIYSLRDLWGQRMYHIKLKDDKIYFFLYNKFDGDFTKETKLELIKQIKLGLENGIVKHHQKVLEREKEWNKKKTDLIMESNKKEFYG